MSLFAFAALSAFVFLCAMFLIAQALCMAAGKDTPENPNDEGWWIR